LPERIQRRRVKGWRMPPNTICVTRPGKWGNPFNWKEGVELGGEERAKGAAVDLFREWLRYPARFPDKPNPPCTTEIKAELRGKNLACFCAATSPCHADVLLEIAND
jgi:hypothetical protein